MTRCADPFDSPIYTWSPSTGLVRSPPIDMTQEGAEGWEQFRALFEIFGTPVF